MKKIKEEIQKAKDTLESLISLKSQQKIYLVYDFDIDINKSKVKTSFEFLGQSNSELEKELFTKKIKDLNSDIKENNLKTIEEEEFDKTINFIDLDKNPISIELNNDKINIIYLFCLEIKEKDKYFNNIVKMLEEN